MGHRQAALDAAEARRVSASGTFAALQLLYGAAAPVQHRRPFCIVRIPGGFEAASATDVLEFEAFFLTGVHSKVAWVPSAAPLQAAKGLVFCTGLGLEPAVELTDAAAAGMHMPELKEELAARALPVNGNKGDLVTRLKGVLSTIGADRQPQFPGRALTTAAKARLEKLAPAHRLWVEVP